MRVNARVQMFYFLNKSTVYYRPIKAIQSEVQRIRVRFLDTVVKYTQNKTK